MTGEYGYKDNVAAILLGGQTPPIIQKVNLGTIANCYAGRLLTLEDTDYDRKVCTGVLPPTGWLGYEHCAPQYRPAAIDTIYVVDDKAPEYKGGGFVVKGQLAKGCSVAKGQLVANWADGQVIGPVVPAANGMLLGIPFGPNDNSEQTTYIELPADMAIMQAFLDVVTVDAGETIDVGLLSSQGGGDANGLIAAASVATAGKVIPKVTVTTGSSEVYLASCTIGELLADTFTAGTDAATDVGTFEPLVHVCDGTAKTVSYTGSAGSDTAAGWIYLALLHENLRVVGQAEQTVDATAAAANLAVLSKI